MSRLQDLINNACFSPDDSEDERLSKSLLIFATGLVSVATMLWLLLYWQLGPRYSMNAPLIFQGLLAGNLLLFLKTRRFDVFRITQLGLFLFAPFVMQWSMGNFIASSGISLWALLAPIGAALMLGVRQAMPWFIAYLVLTALSGGFDWYVADLNPQGRPEVPLRTSVVFFALNFATVSTLVFLLVRHAVEEKRKLARHLAEAHQKLQAEQVRSEDLLLNILPQPIADRLKAHERPIADGFADVTVMFADIVNFTQVAAGLPPRKVFGLLNDIFSAFDELAERHGLEKIKTIGDAYMVAGGLNSTNTDYCHAIAEMALDMRDLLANNERINAGHLEIRIGIGTGPVVAGVVGTKKLIYDLWGDTVNIASRITSEGVPGMIQVDTTTYHRLQDGYRFHPPQQVWLKGKGETTVYRLIDRKPHRAVTPAATGTAHIPAG